MESAQAEYEEFFRGYRDGWQSVPGSGEPPPPWPFVRYQFVLDAKPYYESGCIKGRADALEQMPNA